MPTRRQPQAALGRAIQRLRTYEADNAPMTQAQLARAAGEDPGWLSRLESGQVNPTWARVKRLCKAMDLDLGDLADAERRQEFGED
jgi:transcriptional regulator with XRE-family HTH domain